MEPVKVFSGNEREAGAIQHLLNSHLIGTWVRQTRLVDGADEEDALASVDIFIEAQLEAKARFVLTHERLDTVF